MGVRLKTEMSLRGVVAIALLLAAAFAMSAEGASAGTLTSPASTTYTSTLKAESEGSISLHNAALKRTTTCASSLEGEVTAHGLAAVDVKLTKLTFSGCSNHVTVLSPGTLRISGAGGADGTVTWSGAEITTQHTDLGINCTYSTTETHIGTLTGSNSANATLDIGSAAIPRTGHSAFCGSQGTLTGSYKFTTPSTLVVDS